MPYTGALVTPETRLDPQQPSLTELESRVTFFLIKAPELVQTEMALRSPDAFDIPQALLESRLFGQRYISGGEIPPSHMSYMDLPVQGVG